MSQKIHGLVLTILSIFFMCHPSLAEEEVTVLGEVTVTGTKEKEPRAETPATVDVIKPEEIESVKPAHPSEIVRLVPGVHVNVTSGEGHMTAIRQPITTRAVYLYLEDGIPTRSTGFFNHNALYELNVPQAESIEISKGPGTALYGSDAIGGVINVITRPAPLKPEAEATVEAGSFGWYRALLTAGTTRGTNGIRTDLNLTHTDGWRDATDYDRQSFTFRWDRVLESGSTLKTVISFSNIDQHTAGSSAVSRDDYLNNPETNYTPISFRKVQALRISTAFEREKKNSLLSLTPYVRYNTMEMLPNWSLTYDPQLYTTGHRSLGLLARYRRDLEPMRTRVVAGVDMDYSPGFRLENRISPVKTDGIFTAYSKEETIYDYDVTFTGISPYIHVEFSPLERLRMQGGLRYDHIGYDYTNNLDVVTTGKHRRPADTSVSFDHVSPKLGLTYAFTPDFNGFLSYRHAFRTPSESMLFRQGQAISTVDLEPVRADNFEAGLRGSVSDRMDYEVSVYYMAVKDDILSYRNTVDGTRETMNAGKTLHRGVELGVGAALTERLRLDVSYSYAKHTYEEWTPKTGVDYSGNEMSSAPREIMSTRIGYTPAILGGGKVELEWERLGSYWMDDENTHKYDGHNLFHLRANYLFRNWEVFGRIINLTDERYATRASYSKFRGEEFAPGMPLTVYGGLSYRFL